MKSFFTDIPGAFRNGVLNAPSTKRKVFAWVALSFLGLLALMTLVFAVICFSSGFVIQGFTFTMNTLTFLFLGITVIYQASTAEIPSRW